MGLVDDRLEASPYILDVQGRIVQVEPGEADRFQPAYPAHRVCWCQLSEIFIFLLASLTALKCD